MYINLSGLIMPMYYFDLSHGDAFHLDDTGTELSGPEAARQEALDLLPDLTRSQFLDGDTGTVSIAVRDEDGEIVFVTDLNLSIRSPKASERQRS